MNLGDKIQKQIYTGPEGGSLLPAEIGTVVYIHPEGRFYTLEFKFERHGQVGAVRESYLFPVPAGSSRSAHGPKGAVAQEAAAPRGGYLRHI